MELSIIYAVQSWIHPVLDGVMEGITFLAEPVPAALVILIFYWSVDRERGEYLLYTVLLSLLCNNMIKGLVDAPRPIGQPGVRSHRLHTATGSSFPSGHTQGAASLATALALLLKKRWFTWLAALFVGLVALSRIYLGLHWPRDVLFGAALGVASAFGARWLFTRVKRREWLPLVGLCGLPLLFFAGHTDLSRAVGLLLGMAVGLPLQRRWAPFETEGLPLRVRALRALVGIALLGAAYGATLLLPFAGEWFELARSFGLVALLLPLAPWVFRRLGLCAGGRSAL